MSELEFTTPCEVGDDEWQRRLALFLADPSDGWWWLSFADTDAPAGEQFLGLTIVPAGNVVQAAHVARMLGANPGGQVAGYPLESTPKPELVGRLILDPEAREVAASAWWIDDA